MGNLSPLSPLTRVACRQCKQTTREALRTESCQLGIFSRRPKKSVNLPLLQISVAGRLCKSVGDVSFPKNMYAKGNRALLAAAEDIYGRPLRQDNLLPHLLCRPCERRLRNFIAFKTVISESQRSHSLKGAGR